MWTGVRFGSTVHQKMSFQMSGNARRKVTTGEITLVLFLGVSVALIVSVMREIQLFFSRNSLKHNFKLSVNEARFYHILGQMHGDSHFRRNVNFLSFQTNHVPLFSQKITTNANFARQVTLSRTNNAGKNPSFSLQPW